MIGQDTDDTISAGEIAVALDIGLPAVSNWRRRHRSFPRPIVSGKSERFQTSAVAEWLKDRKIAAPQRSPDEPEGTTYLDRFRRHREGHAVTEPDSAWSHDGFDQAATRAAKVFRVEGVTGGVCEILLALLWVLIERPEDWSRLVSAPDEAPDLLARIDLQASPRHWVPLLPDTVRETISGSTWHRLLPVVSELAQFVPENGRIPEAPLLEQVERWLSDGQRSDHVLPAPVAELMVALVDPVAGDTLVDPYCRAGELLSLAAAHGRERQRGGITLLGRTPSTNSLRITLLVCLLTETDTEIRSFFGVQDFMTERAAYDVIVVNPPFNLKPPVDFDPDDPGWRYGRPPTANLNFAWLQGVVSGLRPRGRAAILTSANAAQSRSLVERGIRSRMIADGVVDGVIALPDRLFSSTSIPTCLWILRAPGSPGQTQTLFVDATSLGVVGQRGRRTLARADVASVVDEFHRWRGRSRTASFKPTGGFSGHRPTTEIAQGDADLNPRIHVVPPDTVVDRSTLRDLTIERLRLLGDLRASTRRSQRSATEAVDRVLFDDVDTVHTRTTVTLGSVCEILSGAGSITASSEEPDIPIVSPRNINHCTVSDTVFASAPEAVRRDFLRYLLAPGDIIGVRSGNVGRFGLFTHRQVPWLLGSGCLRIRPKIDEVDAAFLVHLLGTEAPQNWIRRRAAGSVLTTISADGIRELPVPLPPLEEQKRIGEILLALDAETLAHERAARESSELSATVAEALTSGAVGLRGAVAARHSEDTSTLEG